MGSAAASTIRQIDWRFLLPAPAGDAFDHLLLLGGTPAMAACLLELGVARRVSRQPRDGDLADAVVVLAGASASADEGLQQLADGGAFYWEVDRRTRDHLTCTPSRAAARLRRRGLTPASTFWVKPGFRDRQMFLPLGAGGAMRWYLDTIFRATSLPRRLLKRALRTIAGAGAAAIGALAPCFAVTAVRGPARRPAILDRVLGVHRPELARLEPLLLANGLSDWNRIAVLLFDAASATPAAVMKLPRRPALNALVEWEHAVVAELAETLGHDLAASVPASTLLRWGHLSVALETCVPGASLHSRGRRHSAVALDDLERAARWLADFHAQTTSVAMPAREWLTERLQAQQADYAARFGTAPAESALFAAVDRYLARVETGTVPIVWQHTDFGPWNVYRDGDRISVIDWEVARQGPALVDLLYFVTQAGLAIAGHDDDEACCRYVEALFCDPAATEPAIVASRRHLAAYMARLGIAPALQPVLLVYAVLEQALERARRLSGVGGADPGDRRTNEYVAYLDVLARHAGTIFGARGTHGPRVETAA